MKRNYEVALVLTPGLSEDEYKALETKIGGWIQDNGGNVNGATHWGRRRLAYQIGLNREGYYVFLDADMESRTVNEISQKMNIDSDILRFLVVREDE